MGVRSEGIERCAGGPTVATPDDGHPFQVAELILPAHDQVATTAAIVDNRCHVHPQLVVVSRFDVLRVLGVAGIAPEERRRDGVACPISNDEQVPSVIRHEERTRKAEKAIAGLEVHGRVDHQRQVAAVSADLESDQGVVDPAEGHLDRRTGTVDVLPRERGALGERARGKSNLQLARRVERDRSIVAQANRCRVDPGFDSPGAAQNLAFWRIVGRVDPRPDAFVVDALKGEYRAVSDCGLGRIARASRPGIGAGALEIDPQRVAAIGHQVAAVVEGEDAALRSEVPHPRCRGRIGLGRDGLRDEPGRPGRTPRRIVGPGKRGDRRRRAGGKRQGQDRHARENARPVAEIQPPTRPAGAARSSGFGGIRGEPGVYGRHESSSCCTARSTDRPDGSRLARPNGLLSTPSHGENGPAGERTPKLEGILGRSGRQGEVSTRQFIAFTRQLPRESL